MRIRALLAISAAVAGLSIGSAAQAAMTEKHMTAPEGTFERLASGVGNFFAPRYQLDGSVYGVRARRRGTLPSIQILPPHVRSGSLTPDVCGGTAAIVGWCDTPHDIAASAFGWDFSASGAGAIVGIVDTGIDLNHVEFAGRVLTGGCIVSSLNACTNAWDMVGGDNADFDTSPNVTHGTHVAGIAAGANVGIAYGASILPVKVCSSTNSGCAGVTSGIVLASELGADVINVSIGGPILSRSDIAGFRTAISNGSLLVVAAGNAGIRYPTGGFLSGAALKDGVRGSMIVVGATGVGGTDGYGRIARFSQTPGNRCEIHGGTRYCMKDYFVVAPGYYIWSAAGDGPGTADKYGYLSGTSMATPYVSGVATLIKGQWPDLTSSQIADIIFNTTDDLGAPGSDRIFGRGAVDVTKALDPLGYSAVVTSGTTMSTASGSGGAGGATATFVSGPIAAAVRNSSILRNVMVVDSYGRNFTANLTHSVYSPGFIDFNNMMFSDEFNTVTPFAGAVETDFGTVAASGFVVRTTTPRLLSGEFRTTDRNHYDLRDFELSASLMPGVVVNAGYKVDMAGNFNGYDARGSQAYDGLFFSASAVNSPYVGLTDGGSYIGSTIAVGSGVHLKFAASALNPQRPEYQVPVFSMLDQLRGPQRYFDLRTAQSMMAGASWDFASWGGLGLTATQTDEQNGLLGGFTTGALDFSKSAKTTSVGLSARLGFGDGWVTTVSYSEGITQLNLRPNGLVTDADTLRSRAYGLAIAKHGLFSDSDSLGFAVSRPVQFYSGGLNITAATSLDTNRNLVFSSEHLSLASGTPETDFEFGYVTSFLDGAVALQANAGYQMNLAGQNGTNALSVLSRVKINF